MSAAAWIPFEQGQPVPPEGVLLEVITPGGDQRHLKFSSNLWWLPDMEMYVYFSPSFWRVAEVSS